MVVNYLTKELQSSNIKQILTTIAYWKHFAINNWIIFNTKLIYHKKLFEELFYKKSSTEVYKKTD